MFISTDSSHLLGPCLSETMLQGPCNNVPTRVPRVMLQQKDTIMHLRLSCYACKQFMIPSLSLSILPCTWKDCGLTSPAESLSRARYIAGVIICACSAPRSHCTVSRRESQARDAIATICQQSSSACNSGCTYTVMRDTCCLCPAYGCRSSNARSTTRNHRGRTVSHQC